MNVNSFLRCQTPDSWLEQAVSQLPILLIDHANCEKKAASTALNLMYRHVDQTEMILRLSKLAREELRHFEQVVAILKGRNISYAQISSARYAGELRASVRTHEPARLIDILIVSAIVEARSCERFSRLVAVLDEELAEFYASLLKSEARHFKVYLQLAEQVAEGANIDDRIDHFLAEDERLITSPDPEFRFHSGAPL
ncbi:MAG: tRNA-(ms[2]io[6]A)-hydroxylase [Pseudomonadales bacterium]|nr:tRNA-(ms[2]io[6]A)-hydroxylase [Pseudomonadales bacterium]MBO6657987.1 tRNA-(ms[2]io[6]A)-hydroxylase [Pseudomonadales bacterium]MBO6701553.1 tRNA-(ms[2]io[6]A)-hydroxylase [Pseudomonadales bacterium]MBO7007921.1 tRNA-(ms[2]io[6]A)-hydroxylase [Pseudomonadales bacterium]